MGRSAGGPKRGRNRQRFDLAAPDLAAEVERLVALGATELGDRDGGVELADPDGNEFSVRPADRFVALVQAREGEDERGREDAGDDRGDDPLHRPAVLAADHERDGDRAEGNVAEDGHHHRQQEQRLVDLHPAAVRRAAGPRTVCSRREGKRRRIQSANSGSTMARRSPRRTTWPSPISEPMAALRRSRRQPEHGGRRAVRPAVGGDRPQQPLVPDRRGAEQTLAAVVFARPNLGQGGRPAVVTRRCALGRVPPQRVGQLHRPLRVAFGEAHDVAVDPPDRSPGELEALVQQVDDRPRRRAGGISTMSAWAKNGWARSVNSICIVEGCEPANTMRDVVVVVLQRRAHHAGRSGHAGDAGELVEHEQQLVLFGRAHDDVRSAPVPPTRHRDA